MKIYQVIERSGSPFAVKRKQLFFYRKSMAKEYVRVKTRVGDVSAQIVEIDPLDDYPEDYHVHKVSELWSRSIAKKAAILTENLTMGLLKKLPFTTTEKERTEVKDCFYNKNLGTRLLVPYYQDLLTNLENKLHDFKGLCSCNPNPQEHTTVYVETCEKFWSVLRETETFKLFKDIRFQDLENIHYRVLENVFHLVCAEFLDSIKTARVYYIDNQRIISMYAADNETLLKIHGRCVEEKPLAGETRVYNRCMVVHEKFEFIDDETLIFSEYCVRGSSKELIEEIILPYTSIDNNLIYIEDFYYFTLDNTLHYRLN